MSSKSQLAIVALLIGFAAFLILTKSMWWKEQPSVDREALEKMQIRLNAMEQDLVLTRDSVRVALDDMKRLGRSLEVSGASSLATPSTKGEDPAGAEPHAERPVGETARPTTRSLETMTLEIAMAEVMKSDMSDDDWNKLWKRIRDAGLSDAVIKELEKRTAANPKDPDLQTRLGSAYLEKLQELPQGPESGALAMKADQAFDKALELDPEHWDARFVKAVALSFWPAAFGKGGEAIKHFETLVGQQERQSPREEFASTYYFLGNMYLQMGQRDQAISTWQRGLKLFPTNAELQQQLASAGR
jgi:hypothetical protein